MQLYYSSTSPFVRKVLICAIESGLAGKIENLACAAHPVQRDRGMVQANPLAQVPTLITDEGMSLYDSPVICEYLCTLSGNDTLIPRPGPARWQALVEQALADGLMNAAVMARAEIHIRPKDMQWQPWLDGQMSKIGDCLAQFERWTEGFGDRLDIGTISVACALGYLDFRHSAIEWRKDYPTLHAWYQGFEQQPSMRQTAPFVAA